MVWRMHAFTFHNGQIKYTNKFLRSDPYKEVFERGNIYFGGFSTPDEKSLWENIISFFKMRETPYIQNANVNVVEIAKQPVALTETPLPVRFDIESMNTLGVLNYQDILPKKDVFESAHPQKDIQSNEQINYLVEFGRESFYVVYRLNPNTPSREVIAKIPVKKPAYMHSFALTQNFIILVEFPFTVNPLDLILNKKGFINNFAWDPAQGTNFIVINRKTGLYTTINHPKAFFAFHHANAFENGENIILDIVTYPDAQVITGVASHGDLKIDVAKEKKLDILSKNTKLLRYSLSLKDQTIQSKELLNESIEFPRINENFNTQEYRYLYLADPRSAINEKDERPLYKFDTKTNQILQWSEPGLMPGEPVFIANPAKTDEDEGVIVTIVLDDIKKKAFLLMLDAKTFKEIARSYAPLPIPIGLHGQFFRR